MVVCRHHACSLIFWLILNLTWAFPQNWSFREARMFWTHSEYWKNSGPSTLLLISLESEICFKCSKHFLLLAINMFLLQPLLNILNEYLLVLNGNIHLVPSNHYWNILGNTHSWSNSQLATTCAVIPLYLKNPEHFPACSENYSINALSPWEIFCTENNHPGYQSFCDVSLRAPVEKFHWKFSFSKFHSTVHLKLIFLNELPTFQSCLICLMMSSLVLAMAKDGGLSTENTSRKGCPEIIERCRMAGN